MRNLVFLAFLALVGFVVVGWFMDWYSIAGLKTPTGKHSFQVDIHSSKIRSDLGRGKEKLSDTIHKVKEGAENQVEEAKEIIQPLKAEKPVFSAPRF